MCGIRARSVIVASSEAMGLVLLFAGVVGLIGAGLLAAGCHVLRRTRRVRR